MGRRRMLTALIALLSSPVIAFAQREDAASAPRPQATTAESYPIELWLETQYGPRESARPAPGIHVEIGIQDSSRAVEPDSRPLELQRPVLATATSDAQGELRVTVPVPVEWRTRSAFLWVRVETPGDQRFVQHFHPRSKPERERMRVWPGGTVFGRALDEHGAPLAGARVSLLREQDGAFVGGYAGSRTLPDGSFALHFHEAGRHGIHVRDEARGSSPRFELELDPARMPEPVELAIRGGPALAGRLLDPYQAPIAGAWVVAVPSELGPAPTPADLFEAEHAGGLLGGKARTGLDGSFELPALLAGTYDFHVVWCGDEDSAPTERQLGSRLARLALEAGRRDLVLRHGSHRLEVVVRAADGTPVLPRANEKGVLELPELRVQDLTDVLRSPPASFVGGRVVYPLEPGHEYLVRWQENAVPLLERRLEIERSTYRVELPLTLGTRGAPARLAVRVLEPSGVDFEGPILTVTSQETGEPVSHSVEPGLPPSNAVEGSVWTLELAPGRYRVRATSEALVSCVIEHPLPRTPFTAAERELELASGQDERLELRLGAAGHLDFECARPGTGPGEDEAQAFYPRPNVIDPEFACTVLRGAELWLVGDGRRIRLEAFEVEAVYDLELDWLLPGWPARGLDPLPPGEWTLRAERDGKVPFETRVRIEAGQVTTVRW